MNSKNKSEEVLILPLPAGEGWGEGRLLESPHPAFGHLLPEGEGFGWGEGRLLESPHPAFGHLLPEGEGLARIFSRRASAARWAGLLMVASLLVGCSKSPPPVFHLNMQGRDPSDFRVTGGDDDATRKEKQARLKGQQDIVDALYGMFGTPDEPYVFEESGLDLKKVQLAAGPTGGNADGTQRGLYRQHCVHCHGITGDGAGPTAAFLLPYPRDYRRGLYKFKSTERASKPTNADLERILRAGINGTAMPSFTLLPSDEIEALVEYVKYLSVRGEVELAMGFQVYDNEEPLEMTHDALAEQFLKPVADSWAEADSKVIQPPDHAPIDTPEKLQASIAKGKELFLGAKAQCTKCHGPTALGDGSEEAIFDDWNKDKDLAKIDRWLLPKQELKARNLRLGIYRFGRSPADLYRRVHAGINGAPMPGAGPAPGNPGVLKPEEIWQIVDYVRSLPYESASHQAPGETVVHKSQL
jgi:mono/diheme cytochrome c family protein